MPLPRKLLACRHLIIWLNANIAWFLWYVCRCVYIHIHIYEEACGCIRVFHSFHFRWTICIKWKQLISNASVPKEEGQLPPLSPKGVADSSTAFYSLYGAFPACSHPPRSSRICLWFPAIYSPGFLPRGTHREWGKMIGKKQIAELAHSTAVLFF